MTDFEQYRQDHNHDYLDYANMLRRLLPYGRIWGYYLPEEVDVVYDSNGNFPVWNDNASSSDIINDSNISSDTDNSGLLGKLMMVIGAEFARLEQRSFDLINESTAGLSVELVEEYREQYVRTDEVEQGLVITDEDVTRTAHAKEYTINKPFTKDNAEELGSILGFTINVVEGSTAGTIAVCGVGRCGSEDRCGSNAVFFTIVIEVTAGTANYELMQNIFDYQKPAHVVLVWDDQR